MRFEHIRQCVAKSQFPQKKENINYWLPGATEDKVENADHVPTCMEDIGNVSWGFQSDNWWHVVTGGKEKNRFTAQLLFLKSGGGLENHRNKDHLIRKKHHMGYS